MKAVRYMLLGLSLVVTLPGTAQQSACFSYDSLGSYRAVADSDFGRSGFFIVGEIHNAVQTPEVKLVLIKYLNQTRGITDIYMEIGQAAAYLYNWYLETGDTSFITSPGLVYANSAENKLFWSRLYAFNKELSVPLTIHGMDFERMEFIKALRLLRVDKSGQTSFLQSLDTMHADKVNDLRLLDVYAAAGEDMQTHQEHYRQVFGENFRQVQDILLNKNSYRRYDDRNAAMYENIVTQLALQERKQFLIFTGVNHCDRNDPSSLSSRLADGDVCNCHLTDMVMVCKGCTENATNKNVGKYYGPHTYQDDVAALHNLFSEYSGSGCMMQILPSYRSHIYAAGIYSQYLLLINKQ